MSDRKKYMFLLILLLCFLVGCNAVFIEDDIVDEAIRQGIITPIAEHATREIQWDVIRIGSIEQHLSYHVMPFFPERRSLGFSGYGGEFSGAYVSVNDRVSAGDLLAELFTTSEALEIERDRLVLRYNQHQARFETENQTLGREIARSSGLHREQLEHQLQQLIFYSNNYSEYLLGRINNINCYLVGEQIHAPFDGIITYVSRLEAGDYIHSPGQAIFEIACDSILHFSVTGSTTVIRHGDTFYIRQQSGNLEIYVQVISDPLASRARASEMQFILAAVCQDSMDEILDDAELTLLDLASIPFGLSTSIPLAVDAVLASRDAIHEEDDRNFVFIYEGGNLLKRYVTLGVQFGNDVQILAGLEPGQKVMLP